MIEEYSINIGSAYEYAPKCWQNFITELKSRYPDWLSINAVDARKIVMDELALYNARRECFITMWSLYFDTEKDRTVFILKWG